MIFLFLQCVSTVIIVYIIIDCTSHQCVLPPFGRYICKQWLCFILSFLNSKNGELLPIVVAIIGPIERKTCIFTDSPYVITNQGEDIISGS